MVFQRHCVENGRPTWSLCDWAAEYIRVNNEIEKPENTRYSSENPILSCKFHFKMIYRFMAAPDAILF